MNEETKDPEKTPGRAATLTVLIIVAPLPAHLGVAALVRGRRNG